jgi:large exoprotein involved in heme utilization and adhesion
VSFAQTHQLRPGIALSAEQVAALTSDIVWLEAQTITLPDGSTTQGMGITVGKRMQSTEQQTLSTGATSATTQ